MQYRLQQITEIQKLLESERQKREKLSRNYKKCLKAVKATDGVLAVSFVGLSTVSVIFLSTVIASPAGSHGNRSRITRSWTSFHRRRIS